VAGLGGAVGPAAAQRVPEMPPELAALADLNLEQRAAAMRPRATPVSRSR
jgi:hypothetical protein